jgi:hypothetical protein
MHSTFIKEEPSYKKDTASALFDRSAYPALFECMRAANKALYFTSLVQTFSRKRTSGIYARLLESLRHISPTFVITTNVDEILERQLGMVETIQRSDIERLPGLLHEGKGFVCKLHGSVSSVESMVFSQRDYDHLESEVSFFHALQTIFQESTVLFLGYGLRDDHVLKCLERSSAQRPLFGTGPHFVITASENLSLPDAIRPIRYIAEPADHRSALLALEVVANSTRQDSIHIPEAKASQPDIARSLYYIRDVIPPGKVNTSQTMNVEALDGSNKRQMIVGEGYIDEEVKLSDYFALHDIIVGLVCFDVVCFSIHHLGAVHKLLGSDTFWLLVKSGAIVLVVPPADLAVVFENEHSLVGDLGAIAVGSTSSTPDSFSTISTSELIRKHILAAPGKESEAEDLFHLLESSTIDMTSVPSSAGLPQMTRSALINPSIRNLLGVSAGTPLNAVPRWTMFPILRLAGVVRGGLVCQHIRATATRMIWGSEKLASVTFSAISSSNWADDAASYVLTGRFNSNLGAIVATDLSLLGGILAFRDSASGVAFRREIAERLATNEGGHIVSAINAGLHQALPVSVLQQARDQLSGLFLRNDTGPRLAPAVWGDLRNAEARIASWRARSRSILEAECAKRRIGPYDACPCGSGDRLKFCCAAALK